MNALEQAQRLQDELNLSDMNWCKATIEALRSERDDLLHSATDNILEMKSRLAAMTAERDELKRLNDLHNKTCTPAQFSLDHNKQLREQLAASQARERDALKQSAEAIWYTTPPREMSEKEIADINLGLMPDPNEWCMTWQQRAQTLGAQLHATQDKLTASQAYAERLREVLKLVRADLVMRSEMDPDDGGAVLNISNGVLRRMDEALALPYG
jgi:Skp family chaperone for outer membrane proteins